MLHYGFEHNDEKFENIFIAYRHLDKIIFLNERNNFSYYHIL